MASWEGYTRPRSRHHDHDHDHDHDYDYSSKTTRRRHDSRLDPHDTCNDLMHKPSLHPSPPTRNRSRAHRSREHSRTSRRWPPAPTVEDEEVSLAREVNPERVDYDPLPSRGAVDQEPILIDVPDHIPDRRFVWVNSTPPTSDDESSKVRGSRKDLKLDTGGGGGLPEMQRAASPYSWSKPSLPSRAPARTSAEIYLSPDSVVAPESSYSTPPVKQGRKSVSEDITTPRSSSQQYDPDSANSTRQPSRYSWTKSDADKLPSMHSSPTTPHTTPSAFIPDIPKRRPGSSEGGPSDYLRKAAPPIVASLQQSEKPPSRPRPTSESNYDSRDYSSPPAQSSRSSTDRLRDSLPPTTSSSRPTSRGGSNHASPQPSPRLVNPSSDYPWGATSAAPPPRRPNPPSRLASSTYPTSPLPQSPAPQTPLPYPGDDRCYQTMPSEKDHQYFPDQRDALLQPPLASPASRTDTSRRPMPSRHSSAEQELPASAGASRNITRQRSPNSPGQVRPSPPTSLPLPLCSRSEYKSGYTDWYTLEGCLNFNICPHCMETTFGGTPYRAFFKSSPPRPYNEPIVCDFSNPWIRLAWLLTNQRRLSSLSLLVSLANIADTEEPCPEQDPGVRYWYSIRDRDGHFLREFVVCPQDVKRLEALLPGFRGLFVRLPSRSYGDGFDSLRRKCSLRPKHNNRYTKYLDCLIHIHEAAVSAHRMPNPDDFILLVKEKTSVPECTRDDLVKGQTWYYISSLSPAMTVCADCFNEVVVPHLRSDSDVAMRFNRSPQTVRNEGRNGSSCQLYSSRMRRVFRRAAEDNDMRYLTRKAKDRKEVEDGLQERVKEIRDAAESLTGRSGYAVSSRAQQEIDRLQDELESIGKEWKRWE